jgi:hypothetical protein
LLDDHEDVLFVKLTIVIFDKSSQILGRAELVDNVLLVVEVDDFLDFNDVFGTSHLHS